MRKRLEDEPPEWYSPGQSLHVPMNAYLIRGEQSLLYDTLAPEGTEQVINSLAELLGDDGLDYLVPSHPKAPHAGNVNAILEHYPDATLLSSDYGRGEELYYLENANRVRDGDTRDLGGFVVEFVEATFPDTAFHIWMFERNNRALFTADWMGAPHMESNCLRFADEGGIPIPPSQFVEFQARGLRWLQFCDVDRVHRAIEELMTEYEPEIIAPAHGIVIRENVPEYTETMKSVVDQIAGGDRLSELR